MPWVPVSLTREQPSVLITAGVLLFTASLAGLYDADLIFQWHAPPMSVTAPCDPALLNKVEHVAAFRAEVAGVWISSSLQHHSPNVRIPGTAVCTGGSDSSSSHCATARTLQE
ncbi:hypothetical protein FKM82_021073 [Ascaphus truei]